jgi:hypothetical protein
MAGKGKGKVVSVFNWGLDGGDWPASRPGRFTPVVRSPGAHWIEGWLGPRSGLDAVAKRQKSDHCPCRELNPDRPARSPFL